MILKNKKLILFDLGGTLIDSLPDITIALNKMLESIRKKTYPEDTIRTWLGNGLEMLVKRALSGTHYINPNLNEEEFKRSFHLFLELYNQQNYSHTLPYPNVTKTLETLAKKGYQMAVLTNNPEHVIQPILTHTNIQPYFKICLGNDSLPQQKPHPMPLLYICEQLHITPQEAVMVGDSKNDILAAHKAGIESIGLTYGYNYGEDIKNVQPSIILSDFGLLLNVLE